MESVKYRYLNVQEWFDKIDKQVGNQKPNPPPFPPGTIVKLGFFGERETKKSKQNKANYNIIMDYYTKKILRLS
jgi:hypothetical protein